MTAQPMNSSVNRIFVFGRRIQRRRKDGRPSAVDAARRKMNTISAAMPIAIRNATNDSGNLLKGARRSCTRTGLRSGRADGRMLADESLAARASGALPDPAAGSRSRDYDEP